MDGHFKVDDSPTGQVKLLPYNNIIGSLVEKHPRKEIRLSSEEVYDLIGDK